MISYVRSVNIPKLILRKSLNRYSTGKRIQEYLYNTSRPTRAAFFRIRYLREYSPMYFKCLFLYTFSIWTATAAGAVVVDKIDKKKEEAGAGEQV